MKRRVMKRLFTVAGLSLLLTIGLMLSLCLVSLPSIWAQEGIPLALDVVPEPAQVAEGGYVTLTAKVSMTGPVSLTEVALEIVPPPADALIPDPTVRVLRWTLPIDELAPDAPVRRSWRATPSSSPARARCSPIRSSEQAGWRWNPSRRNHPRHCPPLCLRTPRNLPTRRRRPR